MNRAAEKQHFLQYSILGEGEEMQVQVPSRIGTLDNLTVGFPKSTGTREIITLFAFSCGTWNSKT
ncbi:hypothetical protein OROGR_022622 [Orobanche gracilis]